MCVCLCVYVYYWKLSLSLVSEALQVLNVEHSANVALDKEKHLVKDTLPSVRHSVKIGTRQRFSILSAWHSTKMVVGDDRYSLPSVHHLALGKEIYFF